MQKSKMPSGLYSDELDSNFFLIFYVLRKYLTIVHITFYSKIFFSCKINHLIKTEFYRWIIKAKYNWIQKSFCHI